MRVTKGKNNHILSRQLNAWSSTRCRATAHVLTHPLVVFVTPFHLRD
jgi:hypothetical protein